MTFTPQNPEQFSQAAAEWDLERLYQDLAVAKREVTYGRRSGLTKVEKLHLRGLLCGYNPEEIAEQIYKTPRGVTVALSNTVYRYVEKLTRRQPNTLRHWSDVRVWLEAAGYRLPQPTHTYIDSLVQTVRQRCYDRIQTLYSTMQLLDISQPVNLDSFYVEVNILEEIPSHEWLVISDLLGELTPTADNLNRLELNKVRQERIPGFKAVERYPCLMVLGKPGSGKTTFLQHLAIQCNQGSFREDLVPIFIRLKDFASYARDERDFRLLNYINRELRVIREPEAIETILSGGRGLILLDGLDEVPSENESEIVEQIRRFSDDYCHNKLIITCRIAGSNYRFTGFADVEIADFNDGQIGSFAQKWFVSIARNNQENGMAQARQFIEQLNLPENQQIRELAVTPLWLHLTCLVFRVRGEFPSNRVNLYQQGLQIMLVRWDEGKGINRDEVYRNLSVSRKKELLSHIAAVTFEEGDYFFEQNSIQSIITEYLCRLPDADANQCQEDSEAVLKSIEIQHGLLVERANGIYSFSHLTLQEYFTAREIVTYVVNQETITPLQSLVSHLTEKRWREVFLLVVCMLDNPDILLQLMKDKIDGIVATDDNLQEFLSWINQKSIQVPDNDNPAAFRVFYFALDRILDDTVDNTLDPANNPALDSVLDRAINYSLEHRINPIFYLALNRALVHSLFRAIDPGIVRAFVRAFDPELRQVLEQLRQELPHREDHRQSLTEQFRDMTISHRHIGDDWQFNPQQKELLRQYYDANKLLVDCLNSNCYVSREVRQEIEDTLLLPIAEINNRRRGEEEKMTQ